jgi:predicted O-linked N-acetylglucosamine transferase (SPINDLY family)
LAAHKAGRLDEAEHLYRAALAIEPDNSAALASLGGLKGQQGALGEASALLERSLAQNPRQPLARNNLGNVLKLLGRSGEDALAQYDAAIALKPDYVEAYDNKGGMLLELERPEAALAAFDAAIALQPAYAEAHCHRGRALMELERHEDAMASCSKALALKPYYADAYHNRLNALRRLRRYREALDDLEAILRLDPQRPYMAGEHVALKMELCDWQGIESDWKRVAAAVGNGERVSLPFSFLKLPSASALQRRCAEIFAADRLKPAPTPLWDGQRYRHDRIKLAYLSADFREHALASVAAGLFEHHDKARFEVFALSFGKAKAGAMRSRLEAAFEHFIDASQMTSRDIAEFLRREEIDIAVDLMGHTNGARTEIFALRPVALQVNYLGFPGTMGTRFMDYIIADAVVVPEGNRASYSEKIIHLPNSYMPQDSRRPRPARHPTRSEAGLPETGLVYCCFNVAYKFTPRIFDVWMRLLVQLPESVLWLPENNEAAMANLKREVESRGVATGRLVFAPFLAAGEDHLARLPLADLFLDTLPFNAHSTAADALWTGVPVLTCKGECFSGRVAASLLSAAGLPELIAESLEDYEARALALGRDASLRGNFRRKLSAASPLFDTARYTRNLERAYLAMWERQQRGEPPESFAVTE